MDQPWANGVGSAVVEGGTSQVIYLNDGQTLELDVDRLSVVMWWPEPNQESGGAQGADIVLRLQTTCGAYQNIYDYSWDTKKRVFLDSNVGGSCWAIVLQGFSTPPSAWEKNKPQRTVYFAYYYEDEDRDDAEGPPVGIQ